MNGVLLFSISLHQFSDGGEGEETRGEKERKERREERRRAEGNEGRNEGGHKQPNQKNGHGKLTKDIDKVRVFPEREGLSGKR